MYCYYGEDQSTAQGQADANDPTQWDYHSSQSECETADENGNKGQWFNDDFTHQTPEGDWVDDDGRPEGYTLEASTPVPQWTQNAVQNTLGDVQYLGVDLPGINNYSVSDVFHWARQQHQPNGPHSLAGTLYWHGNWCGAGGSGAPTESTDASCLVHDFLYAQYGFKGLRDSEWWEQQQKSGGAHARKSTPCEETCFLVNVPKGALLAKTVALNPLKAPFAGLRFPTSRGTLWHTRPVLHRNCFQVGNVEPSRKFRIADNTSATHPISA